MLIEKLAAVSGEHPHFNLPVEYNIEDIVRTKRSSTAHEAMYRKCIQGAFASIENDSLTSICAEIADTAKKANFPNGKPDRMFICSIIP